mmetsp:Transcript_4923/g.12751  ORF Transcript_4923/g.12751 Transcript_4923/m.12751 type:complete len:985 (-) Transcript_4923:966-3920(-)
MTAQGSGHVEPWEVHQGPEWWEDLSEMSDLTEETLLAELKRQYHGHRYMTWVGDILCVMNPFQLVNRDFISDVGLARYHNIPDRAAWPPHNFALADLAFQKMLLHAKNQVVTISGESGAGKTESAKLFIKMIVHSSNGSQFEGLEEKLLKVNPILEAFGNAKTAMNNNSSRFGKFVQILFTKEGQIQGAMQTEYLLEKSRVCQQGCGEQNFHIFYLIFAWSQVFPEFAVKLDLPDPREMRYFGWEPGPIEEDNILDCLEQLKEGGEENPRCEISVKELKETIDVLGFTVDEVDNIFNALAGIAKLSLLEFEGDEDGCKLAGNRELFESVCKNFGVDPPALEFALTTHVVELPGKQSVEKKYSATEAYSLCDSTGKDTYGKLFHYIVGACNKKLTGKGSASRTSLAMGVLDIFGFEDFERQGGHNSLEQLCINLANEQLQYFFTEHIFGQELAAYAAEGIDGTDIHYEDNQPMLNLILGKRGMFDTLNEQSRLKRSTDETCLQTYHNKFEKEEKLYQKPRMADPVFSLHHYAGTVQYTIADFLVKNRDTLAIEITGTMAIAHNHVVSLIFGGEEGAIGGRKKVVDAAKAVAKAKQSAKSQKGKRAAGANYLAKQFKSSLVSLMDDLNKAEPHFIRCMKPNQMKSKEWEVDDEYTTRQLRYTGMLDTTRIRREGYPSRPTFADFLERYKIIGHPMSKEISATGANCKEILSHSGVNDARIGKTKVFMKHYHGHALDDKLKPFSSAATLIGKFGVGFLARARLRPVVEHKRKQDAIVKAWLDTIPKLASPFFASSEASKQEDGDAMVEIWKEREEAGKPHPESHAKANAVVAAEARRSAHERQARGRKGKPTREQVIAFYKEMGDEQGAGQTEDGRFCAWFHGIVTRVQAEHMLKAEQDGTFLIRLAESRYGYSLSIIWRGRVKHFAIDLDEKGMHTIRGNSRKYRYLNQIVAFHKNHSITDQGDRLLYPCNPGGERNDLAELEVDD